MKKLTKKKAEELKLQGYTQIASVVKSVYATTYYHVNTIDDIIANNGRWIPAKYNDYHRCYVGISGKKIDWPITATTSKI